MSLFDEIMQPTLLLDEAAARANIARAAGKAQRLGLRFRPHFKTHQSAEMGEWFRPAGVTAITASSVEMAEYFAAAGWKDISIAFPANVRQIAQMDALAERVSLGLLAESVETVEALDKGLQHAADLWIKVDVGGRRTGVDWTQVEQAAAVARAARAGRHLRLRGLLTHAGHTYPERGGAAVQQVYDESVARILSVRQALAGMGLGDLEISVGDTPSVSLVEDLGAVDEIRPGNFVLYDAMQLAQIEACRAEDVAAAVACPVVALHPQRSEAVIYGGAIHLSKDTFQYGEARAFGLVCLPQGERWGAPLAGAYVRGLSQEHGILRMAAEDLARLRVGDVVCVIPAHSCLTVQVMRRYRTLDGRWVETLNH